MLVYNITLKVNSNIHEEWLQWQQQVHIPEIMATCCFQKFQMSRILDMDDSEGPTYTIQFYAASKTDYERYINSHAPKLRRDAIEKWGGQFTGFRTIMEVVH